MEIQASRLGARVARDGSPVLLLDQDRSRWDRLLIQRGLAGLRRAEALGLGPYGAAGRDRRLPRPRRAPPRTPTGSASPRSTRRSPASPPPRSSSSTASVAIGMAFGPQAGLDHLDALGDALDGYHLHFSVRGDLLAKLGRTDEARAEFERAASLTANAAERDLLSARAEALA